MRSLLYVEAGLPGFAAFLVGIVIAMFFGGQPIVGEAGERAALILPGKGLGQVRLDMSLEEVEKQLGGGYEKFPVRNLPGAQARWWEKQGWVVYVCEDGGRIPYVGIYRRNDPHAQAELMQYRTKEGVGIDSVAVELESHYGKPTIRWKVTRRQGPNTEARLWGDIGLFADIDDSDKVYAIGVYERYRCP